MSELIIMSHSFQKNNFVGLFIDSLHPISFDIIERERNLFKEMNFSTIEWLR
jgi:hypothetical protein